MDETLMIGLVPLVLLVASVVWVYSDAVKLTKQGTPVIFSSSFVSIRTPQGWLAACLLLWVVFVPLYIAGRSNEL